MYIDEIKLTRPLPKSGYLHDLPVIRALRSVPLRLTRPVTILVGENGSGKSTLLEGIAVAFGFNPEGGTRNFRFSTCASHSELGDLLQIGRTDYPKDGFFLRAESFYNAASYIDELDRQTFIDSKLIDSYGGVSLHAQSHGESFLALVQHRFSGRGLYLLDEPEAALSPMRQLVLLGEIDRLVRAESQLILATHSPMLMAYPGAQVLECTERGLEETSYDRTMHFQLMRRFLNQPENMLAELLDSPDCAK